MTKMNPGVVLALMLALVVVAGCFGGRDDASGQGPNVELRTYDIPEGFDPGEIRGYIRSSLTAGETVLGTAVVYPNGSLVVTAPAGVHEGVERLIAELERKGPRVPTGARRSVTLRYWAIVASPIDGEPGTFRSASRVLQPDGPLQPVLRELVEAYGPLRFGLLEEIRVSSIADSTKATLRGGNAVVQQRILPGPPTIADIEIATLRRNGGPNHQFESRITLEPGRFIVLGQSAYNADDSKLPKGWTRADDTLLFLVVAEQAD